MKKTIQSSIHDAHTKTSFNIYQEAGYLSDCYLFAEGKLIPCHKLLLSIHSSHFNEILSLNLPSIMPVIILSDDVTYKDAEDILKFIYKGQVDVEGDEGVSHFYDIAKKLKIHLVESMTSSSNDTDVNSELFPQQLQNFSNEDDVLVPQLLIEIKTEKEDSSILMLQKEDLNESPMLQKPRSTSSNEKNKEKSMKNTSDRLFKPKLSFGINKRRQSAMPCSAATIERSSTIFRCVFCGKTLKTKATNYKHQRECSLNPNQVWKQCSGCLKRYKPSYFSRHKKCCPSLIVGQSLILSNEQNENIPML